MPVARIPFQSTSSLRTARALARSATQNAATQNQPVPQNHCANASTGVALSGSGAAARATAARGT